MKMRLGIFIAALLLLPLAGLLLSGREWDELSDRMTATGQSGTIWWVILALAGYALLLDIAVRKRTGNSPFSGQRSYFVTLSLTGSVLVWLLYYLNYFAVSWFVGPVDSPLQILLMTILFALLVPSVLMTRALLGSFPRLLKWLARGLSLTPPDPQTQAFVLLPLAIFGLLGGAAWPAQLFWLLWAAPLLLLLALQLLWHESTIFSGLKSGDWGRVICSALSGVVVGNLAIISYHLAGGELSINLPHPLFAQAGYALFGLLCLQLGDVIAENWRGKHRHELFRQKKKFPIPVVVKKN